MSELPSDDAAVYLEGTWTSTMTSVSSEQLAYIYIAIENQYKTELTSLQNSATSKTMLTMAANRPQMAAQDSISALDGRHLQAKNVASFHMRYLG